MGGPTARPCIKRFDKGSFVLMNYCGPSGVTSELERDLKLDDRVFRFQSVKIAEDVDPQELILKEKEKEKKKSSRPWSRKLPARAKPWFRIRETTRERGE